MCTQPRLFHSPQLLIRRQTRSSYRCSRLEGNPLANIYPQAFEGAAISDTFMIKTSALNCCGADWLAYGVPGQKRLTTTGPFASSLVCASPPYAKGRSLLEPVTEGGFYDPDSNLHVCAAPCSDNRFPVQSGVLGPDGNWTFSCV